MAGLLWWKVVPSLKDERMIAVLSALAAASGTLLGFLITALTLLAAVMDRTLVANMRRTGHYQRLIRGTFLSCVVLLTTLVASVTSMFISSHPLHIAFSIAVGLAILAVMQLLESGTRFARIFTLLS
jgi:protein-S-isoprenylcysteine O-methyltransferase Ste14